MRLYSSGREIGPSQKPLPDNTKNTLEKYNHAANGIQTFNPNKQAPQTHALYGATTGTMYFVMQLNQFFIINLSIFYVFFFQNSNN
jgi:hypothetical protein